jgi:hypothetical protein
MGVIGIGIDHADVRAVLVRKKEIVWRNQAPWHDEASLAESIASLLARAPRRRWRRVPVHVAIGAFGSQLKLIADLPAVDNTEVLAAVIREGSASYFLRNGHELVTTGVRAEGEGRVWAGAFDQPLIDAVRVGCQARAMKLRSISPTAAILPLVARNDRFIWNDGAVSLEIVHSGGALKAVRRVPSALLPPDTPTLDPIEPVAALGPGEARYADAYGATLVDPHSPLALGAVGDRPLSVSGRRRRVARASMLGCVGLVAFVLSPVASEVAAYRARAALDNSRSGEAWTTMVDSVSRLEQITAVLNDIQGFVSTRPERTKLLGELAGILPDRSAIVRIQINGSEGTLEVLTPHGAAFVESLRTLPSLASIEVDSRGARQYVGGLDLERMTVRFRTREIPLDSTDSRSSNVSP